MMKDSEIRDTYLAGFEASCKSAGLDPKTVFVKSAQLQGLIPKIFGGLGRAVSRPAAAVAKATGHQQFASDLSTLNTLRQGTGNKLRLQDLLETSGLGTKEVGQTGGRLNVTRVSPSEYKLNYGGKDVNVNHGDLPAELRRHFKAKDVTQGAFEISPESQAGLKSTVSAFNADPMYQTVGKYTAGAGALGLGSAALLSKLKASKKPEDYVLNNPDMQKYLY